jgi:hypothetical protein
MRGLFRRLRAVSPSALLLGVVLLLLATLALVLVAMHARWGTRALVARTHRDMAAIVMAIETYYLDVSFMPAMAMDPRETLDAGRLPPDMPPARSFRLRHQTALMTLTTPIPYLVEYPEDPFTRPHRLTYRYYTAAGHGWFVGSFGPDADFASGGQLMWHEGDVVTPVPVTPTGPNPPMPDAALERLYLPWQRPPLGAELLAGAGPNGAYTYDPTNGTTSAGDIWRAAYYP